MLSTLEKPNVARVTWRLGILVFLLLAATLTVSSPAKPEAQAGPIALKRGIGIHEWLNWSPLSPGGGYQWPPYRDLAEWGSARDFERMKAMGFDFVRLSVDPGPLLASEGARRAEAITRLERAVRAVTNSGLKVILDLHPVRQVSSWSMEALDVPADAPIAANYRGVVTDVAAMLAGIGGDKTALELMNEPSFYPCDGSGGRKWEEVLTGLVRAAREAAPQLTLVVSGACGGSITGLVQLDPARLNDDRLLYSFHFYEPHLFTHQGLREDARLVKGAPWPVDETAIPLALAYSDLLLDPALTPRQRSAKLASVRKYLDTYTAEGWDEERLKSRFGEVRAWATEYGISGSQLLLGEFSVTAANNRRGGALDADRFRWLDVVRREADALGVPWAYWEYYSPHGMSLLMPGAQRRADPVVVEALQLVPEAAELPVGN